MNGHDHSSWKAWAGPHDANRGKNMKMKPPPKPGDSSQSVEGREIVALKGDTKAELDWFLTDHTMGLGGTGIGRSAFIMAALDILRDPFFHDQLVERGRQWQNVLPR